MELSKFSLTFCFIGLALFPPLYVQSAQNKSTSASSNGTVTAVAHGNVTVVSQGRAAPGGSVPIAPAYGPSASPGGSISIAPAYGPSAAPDYDPYDFPAGTVGGGIVVGLIGGAGALIFGIGSIWFILRRKRKRANAHASATVVSHGPAAPGGSVPTDRRCSWSCWGCTKPRYLARKWDRLKRFTTISLGTWRHGSGVKRWSRWCFFFLKEGAGVLIFGIRSIWFILSRRRSKANKVEEDIFDGEFQNGMGPRKFSLVQIAKMTSNFKGEKLGEGGFGAVYRGYLRDLDTNVAVKRISKASKQGIKEYASEVKIISRLRHKNLVKLIGWCHEKGDLILIYEFMTNGSLDSHLFKGKSLLTWDVRYKIVHGLASALFYLHEEGDHCILHRDIKASNIMLDSGFNAKLGDFGLARLVDHAKGSQTTHLAGTLGYMAPEYVSSGKASKEADVYSFGVVALEIACGRRSIEPTYEESRASLVAWVWDLFGNRQLIDAADPKLSMDLDAKEMECLLMVGLWCVHPDPNSRPSIRQTIQVLNFEAPLPKLPSARPTPTYNAPIGSEIQASAPCFSTLTITIPR